jgi:deoxyribonuclease-4
LVLEREGDIMPFGAHMSIAGSIDKAVRRGQEVGCETIQVFVKSANRWKAKPLEPEVITRFQQALEETKISPVIGHTAYLTNLASPDEELWMKSLDALVVEVERCAALGIPFLVMHPGAHSGAGEQAGLNRITTALNEALKRTENSQVTILLETTAGQGSLLGGRFEHLAQLLSDSFYPERLGVCLDTCHIFSKLLPSGQNSLSTKEAYRQIFLIPRRADKCSRFFGVDINRKGCFTDNHVLNFTRALFVELDDLTLRC